MADKLIYTSNDNTQYYTFCILQLKLYTQLNEPTNQNSIEEPGISVLEIILVT